MTMTPVRPTLRITLLSVWMRFRGIAQFVYLLGQEVGFYSERCYGNHRKCWKRVRLSLSGISHRFGVIVDRIFLYRVQFYPMIGLQIMKLQRGTVNINFAVTGPSAARHWTPKSLSLWHSMCHWSWGKAWQHYLILCWIDSFLSLECKNQLILCIRP